MTITYYTVNGRQKPLTTNAFSTTKEAVCFVRLVLGAVGPVIVRGAA